MSCFTLSPEVHATAANSLAYILNSGFNRFGFSAPDSLYKALERCRDRYGDFNARLIYCKLHDLNAKAYYGRYKRSPEGVSLFETPDMPEVPELIQPRQYANHHETLQPWHYKFCKLLDCEIYQASEDATRNDPLLLALVDFSRVYKSFLVSNADDYYNAPWGSI